MYGGIVNTVIIFRIFFVVGISEAWFIFLRNKKFVCILYFIILQMKNIHKLGVRNQFVVRMV